MTDNAVIGVRHEFSEVDSRGLVVLLGNHSRTPFGVWNKFQGNPLKS